MRPPLVLAYHGLGAYPRAVDPNNLMVDPRIFRQQMLTLRRRGYRFVRLTEFAEHLKLASPPDGICAVTFDDGTVDNLTVVGPLLAELDVPATVFVCPGLLGREHFAMPPEASVRLMDADELHELASAPLIDIGSHTSRHVDLSAASAQEAQHELAGSKHELEELLGEPVDTFAYPKCSYSPACPEAAQVAGYAVAVTCGGLGGWRRYELTRESIDSLDGRATFALKSRRLFVPMRQALPGRVMRASVRWQRHGRG